MAMETLQEKIARLKEQKQQMEANGGFDVNEYNIVCNQLNEAEWELEQQQEKDNREQKQTENIQGYVDVVAQMFDALFPAEVYQKLLGLTEYEEKRQQFYQLNHAYYTEKVQEIYNDHNEEIAAKDQKIQLLQKQGLETQRQLDEANSQIETLQKTVQTQAQEIESLNGKIADLQGQVEKGNAAISENSSLRQQITELTEKLDAANKPKETAQPSQNLQQMINSIREKNSAPIKTALEIGLERAQRYLEPPTVNVPNAEQVSSFRGDANQQTDSQTVGQGANTQEVTFPQVPSVPVPEVAAANTTAQVAGETAARDFAKEIDHINARLDRLEKLANLPELEKAS
jgi:chromosome segregation ATPase